MPRFDFDRDIREKILKQLRQFAGSEFAPVAGGILGGMGGAFMGGPLGGIVGAVGGAGVGEALQQRVRGEEFQPREVAKEAAISGAGEIVGIGAGKLLGKVGKAVARKAGDLPLKAIRPSKSQLFKFAKATGEDMAKFVRRNKLFEAGTRQIDDLVIGLQSSFDDIALKSGIQIEPATVLTKFKNRITELDNIPIGIAKNLAKQLGKEQDLFAKRFGTAFDVSELTKLRRQVDQLIPESKFLQDPLRQGVSKELRDIYQGVVREVTEDLVGPAGRSLKELGQELNKAYRFRDLAELQQHLGRGKLPAGLLPSITGTGAGVGSYLSGERDPLDLIRNSLIGASIPWAVNNPKLISAVSKALSAGGKAVERVGASVAQKGLPDISAITTGVASTVGQGIAQLGKRAFLPDIDQARLRQPIEPGDIGQRGAWQEQPTTEGPVTSPEGQWTWDPQLGDWVPTQQQARGEQGARLTQDQIAQLALQAAQSGDPKKALEVVSALAKLMGPTEEKAVSVAAQKQQNYAKSGLRGLEEIRSIIKEDPTILTKQLMPGRLASRKFDSALFKTVEAILRARTGAAAPEEEVRRYMKNFGPRFGDNPDVIEFKLKSLEQDLLDMLGVTGGLPDIDQLLSPYQ